MELGLTLGGVGSVCVDVASPAPFNTSADLALALGVSSSVRSNHQGASRLDVDPTASISSSRMRLDLFPLWSPCETANTGVAADEVEAISSPNSVAFSLQVSIGGKRKRVSEEGEQLQATSSRASDEDENGNCRKKLRLSKEQAVFLEESFKQQNTLNPKQKQALAKQLNLRPRQVEVWFQNRRARTKLKQTEVDFEYLKRCRETLATENRRLEKELHGLRALKSFNPYYTQQPATTLTMCPSCERTTTTTTTATSSASAVATVVLKDIVEPSFKSAPFPLYRPKFFPFLSHNNQPQKSTAL